MVSAQTTTPEILFSGVVECIRSVDLARGLGASRGRIRHIAVNPNRVSLSRRHLEVQLGGEPLDGHAEVADKSPLEFGISRTDRHAELRARTKLLGLIHETLVLRLAASTGRWKLRETLFYLEGSILRDADLNITLTFAFAHLHSFRYALHIGWGLLVVRMPF